MKCFIGFYLFLASINWTFGYKFVLQKYLFLQNLLQIDHDGS